ncbi:DUF3800 domain-containing protein [Methylobacterium fujisawaense]|uniref:DUF3800 domain-containing protein n=1 Tax=Methylobacterium fujisawaense TaxID=107400 RepID=UPI003CF293C8
MKLEVYCDETLPDLFTSGHPQQRYLMIGSLWLPASLREEVKARIDDLRQRHGVHGEMKWRKVSPSKAAFYMELVDLFMSFGLDLRFRCIAVDHQAMNLGLHNGDAELGFYKFYYQVLHHWILDQNEYTIFCDLKLNRDRTRLHTLRRVLNNANRTSIVHDVQSLPSSEVVLLQLCDVLLGAASARINGRNDLGAAKDGVITQLERRLNRARLGPTNKWEEKFNIFNIRLEGGC